VEDLEVDLFEAEEIERIFTPANWLHRG